MQRGTNRTVGQQDPFDSKSDLATHALTPHLSDVVEHDAHATETSSSSSHTHVSQPSATDLLAAMGFKLPHRGILEHIQPTNPLDIA